MKLPHRSDRRAAFSLIELLVAIAIIGVLAALTLAFIVPMLRKGPDLEARNDISKFDEGMQQFQAAFNVTSAPPSPFRLCAHPTQYNSGNAQDVASLQYLNSVFPSLNWNTGYDFTTGKTSSGIDWSGGTTPGFKSLKNGVLLEGDQVLVFFLGGIPSAQGPRGFSSDPKDPTNLPPTTTTTSITKPKGPFFDFKTARLLTRSASANPAHHFYSYADPYGAGPYTTAGTAGGPFSPYVYFSAGRIKNGYNTNGTINISLLNGAVTAYFQPSTTPAQFYNPSSFQVISAGQDGQFGQGGTWSPATASISQAMKSSINAKVQSGEDDLSNFYGAKLGVNGS